MPGKPFQSKLHPFWETIKALRRSRKTWSEIAEVLTGQGCATSKQDVHAFYKRKVNGRVPLGFEEPQPPAPTAAAEEVPSPSTPETGTSGLFEAPTPKVTAPKKKPRYNVDF